MPLGLESSTHSLRSRGSVVVVSFLIVTLVVGVCNCSMFCCQFLFCNHLDGEESAGCCA